MTAEREKPRLVMARPDEELLRSLRKAKEGARDCLTPAEDKYLSDWILGFIREMMGGPTLEWAEDEEDKFA